jgi:hypothetical protein
VSQGHRELKHKNGMVFDYANREKLHRDMDTEFADAIVYQPCIYINQPINQSINQSIN